MPTPRPGIATRWRTRRSRSRIIATVAGAARMAAVGGGDVVRAITSRAGRLARRLGPGLHPHDAAGAARDVEALLPRGGARPRQHPRRGPRAARGEPLRRHADRGHVRLRAGLLRPLRAAAALPPARARPRLQAAGGAGEPVALRHRPGVAREHGAARSSATRRCSSTRAATTRPTGPAGSRRRSTSRAGPASRGSPSSTASRSSRSWRSAARRPRCSWARDGGSRSSLRLDSLLRLKVFPAQVAPPFGVTILDLPGRIPLPSKIVVRALPKIDLKERLGAQPRPRRRLRARHGQDAARARQAGRRAHDPGRRLSSELRALRG